MKNEDNIYFNNEEVSKLLKEYYESGSEETLEKIISACQQIILKLAFADSYLTNNDIVYDFENHCLISIIKKIWKHEIDTEKNIFNWITTRVKWRLITYKQQHYEKTVKFHCLDLLNELNGNEQLANDIINNSCDVINERKRINRL